MKTYLCISCVVAVMIAFDITFLFMLSSLALVSIPLFIFIGAVVLTCVYALVIASLVVAYKTINNAVKYGNVLRIRRFYW
jgi:hypothetical protein